MNLAVRFLLEIGALVSVGIWGWNQSDDWIRYILVAGLPILFGAIWGIFNVPGDPSRSGNAPVRVPGFVRLVLELIFFAAATWALFDMNYNWIGWLFGILVSVHYLVSYDRIAWLLKQ